MKWLMVPALASGLTFLPGVPLQGQTAPAGDSLRLKVDGMVCSLCAYGLERRLKTIEHVERIDVQLDSAVAIVVLRSGTTLSDSSLAREVRRAGFALRGVERYRRTEASGQERGGP
ncbi:MAG: heavy-metal-associated domain-containing protein [Gemmatimonadetes bacterium]|nr:heavy-metal-associated domain-containing protein [Gemmatimonadota bacterium]